MAANSFFFSLILFAVVVKFRMFALFDYMLMICYIINSRLFCQATFAFASRLSPSSRCEGKGQFALNVFQDFFSVFEGYLATKNFIL